MCFMIQSMLVLKLQPKVTKTVDIDKQKARTNVARLQPQISVQIYVTFSYPSRWLGQILRRTL